ncbi:SusC/RagA family TonB-linked outer membrane protein [Chitinophaga sp. SYP-B3965]|uniref:SusC/RagA family TonB-linked outer membrane protein n=1 Tax=Chitinophaga sp. SYP-B3965 TaxID=2663120 RepID=UPI001299B7A9|nr:TonB-dependent receptor [Chitinophaga sp. SYP-B3965]MRG48276.1 SusC/RagA family TonB-linked outer membrane protein [Chitinophaga sp. SYP-B3965]
MKFGSLRLCLRVAGLCLLLQVVTADLQAQQSFASTGPVVFQDTHRSGRMIPLKNVLETVYRKYKLRIVHNEKYTKDVLLPEQVLQENNEKIIASIEAALKPYHLVVNKISDEQYIIAPEVEKKVPAEVKKDFVKMKVSGTVRDKIGGIIIGVNIRVPGTQTGTTTNVEGFYSIEVEPTDTLEFSFIGYESQRISVRNRMDLNVILEPKEGGLNEVVVVGFGVQKKVSLVGAQSTIKPSELKLPGRSLMNALGGRLAGIVSVQRSGEPGYDGADIYIRGISTYASSPQGPLVIVDGVPGRNINDIDPEDIETFTILKDASATAVYGTRGANGVIIVNTKAGKIGKPSINFELNQAATRFTQLPKFVDAPNFMRMYNEGLQMRGRTPLYTEETIKKHETGEDPDLYPNVDWFDIVFNKWALNRKALLNVRGGSEFATYYISAGYYSETGMLKRDKIQSYNSSIKLDRFNFTTNVDVNVTKTTKIELGVNGYIINSNYPGIATNGLFNLAAQVPPHMIPPRYSNGLWPEIDNGGFPSPLRDLTQSGYATEYRNSVRSNIRLKQNLDFLVKGLNFTTMFAFDSYSWNNLNRKRGVQTYFAEGRNPDSSLITRIVEPGSNVLGYEGSRGGNRSFYTETALNYSNTFGKHEVSALALFNQSDYINGDATDLVASIPFRIRGFSGRATYGYGNRYFVEGNFGYNGAENFTPKRRYGFFPSFGVGWVVSNEAFFDPYKNAISYLKFRYTYGLTGNSNTGNRFLFLTRINTAGGFTFGNPGSQVSYNGYEEGLAGSEVSWETGKRQNLGIEIKVLKDRLSLIVDLFKEHRTGILLRQLDVPYSSGYTAANLPYGNVGIAANKGIDITLEYNHEFNKDYRIGFRGNFNYNKNLAIADGLPPWQYPWLNRTGHTISQRFGYVALGLFADSAEILRSPTQAGDVRPGDIKYEDLNGDGLINSFDTKAIGYGDVPRILYGLNLSAGIKRFDLFMFWQGAAMVDFMYSAGHGTNPFYEGPTIGNLYTQALDRWTPDNPNPRPFYPRMSTRQDNTTNYYESTWWVKRADYIRLKEVMIGYNFGVRSLQRFGVKNLRVYLQATNVLTFSPWKIWDPELTEGRGYRYPQLSAYNFGIRFNFL